jgi:release factor glutamine methyltransferase
MMHQPNHHLSIATCLQQGTKQLLASSASARLDAELLLGDALQVPRSYLYAHSERALSDVQKAAWQTHLSRRLQGEPVAYVIGRKAFWDINLQVNSHTLVPRPETELLVAQVLALPQQSALRVLEIGTGSGAITCAMARARPRWQFHATDICPDALQVAKANAAALGLKNIEFAVSDVMLGMPQGPFDVVVSNPPYIDASDPCLASSSLRYEPRQALVAAEQGMAVLRQIIDLAPCCLADGGRVYTEHGATQGDLVRAAYQQETYQHVRTHQDLAGLDRVTGAIKNMSKGDGLACI